MHQTRQFTKRRPQPPMLNQQQSIEGLQVGVQKASRSGLAIQSSAPIHTRSLKSGHDHQEPLKQDHPMHVQEHQQDHSHKHHDLYGNHQHDNHYHDNHHHDHHDHHGHNHHDQNGHGHNHGHDHHGHGHNHGHDHHGHGHNHGHDHHGHGHNHGHDHHEHNHGHGHGHNHGHDHSGHHHAHFPQVYTQPLPSYASIFSTLAPFQKMLFTCFVLYFLIGISVWWSGLARESLAVIGFSYLVLFDAFGVLNLFASSVLQHNPAFSAITTKRPFGARRFEIVVALANTIFLLFGTMYTTKESLEHLLLEGHHGEVGHHHASYPFGLLFLLLLAIGGCVFSNVNLKNHGQLVNLIKQSHNHSDMNARSDPMGSIVGNIFSLSIVASGSLVFLIYLFGMSTPNLDKLIAFMEAGLMLYLGAPTAVALGKVLLQTMPDSLVNTIGLQLRQIQQVPNVISVDKVHFWQNAYGRLIGTVEIQARPEAEEDLVIEAAFSLLESVVRDNGGELTISVVKP